MTGTLNFRQDGREQERERERERERVEGEGELTDRTKLLYTWKKTVLYQKVKCSTLFEDYLHRNFITH